MALIFPTLETAGWKIGDSPDCHIQLVKLTDVASTSEAADAIKRTVGTPNTCFYKDGVFVRSVAGVMTATEVADVLNEIATGKQPQVSQQQAILKARKRLPVVKTQWGTIDLESYHMNCNCPMCQGIRALQSEYRQTAYNEARNVAGAVRASQEPTPSPVADRIMETLGLSKSDVFADIGCGDGRLLIEAVETFGCSAVGIEIDPVKADKAREKVKAAGLSDRITVLTGDAKSFDPEAYGVTAAVAYLYPELLEKLKPMLETIPVLVTPFHQVPGLVMESRGDVWVRDMRNQPSVL
jgi:protein-L-isoaspartate O-methyltransferase